MLDAVRNRDAKKVAELIRQDPGFKVNMGLENDARTLLLYACIGSHRSTVIPLLLAHPDIDVNVKDTYECTPFYYASADGNTPCVREMLKDSRVKVNEPDNDGFTPLWLAASLGRLDVIRWWIASGREMDFGKPGDIRETDAIGVAKRNGKAEIATLLERFKSDAANTRSEVRLELGINGQYYSYHEYSYSYSRTFSISFHYLLHFFYPPPFFHSQFNCEKPFLSLPSLLFSLSLNIRFPCVYPTETHHGAVPHLRWWQARRHHR